MKTKFVLVICGAVLCCTFLYGCRSSKINTVPYKVAEHYFVRNDITGLPPTIILTAEEFEKYFGMATVMGKNGQPTGIDFNKNFIISISETPTNIDTRLSVISLTKDKSGQLILKYRIDRGEKMSYTSQPLVLLIIDKKYDSQVKLEIE